MNTEVIGVPAQLIDTVWAEAWNCIEPAVARNEGYDEAAVYTDLTEGNMQLFVAGVGKKIKGAAVTQLHVYPLKTQVFVLFMGGQDMKEWLPQMEEAVIEFAEKMQADEVGAMARKGFEKFFSVEATGLEVFRRRL